MKIEEEIRERLESLEFLRNNFFQQNADKITLSFDKKMNIIREIEVLKWTLGMIEEKNPDVKKMINFPNHETIEEKVIKIFQKSKNSLTSSDIGLMLNTDYRNINNILSKLVSANKIIVAEGSGIRTNPRRYIWNENEKNN